MLYETIPRMLRLLGLCMNVTCTYFHMLSGLDLVGRGHGLTQPQIKEPLLEYTQGSFNY